MSDARRVWVRFFALIPLAIALVLASQAYIHQVGNVFSCTVSVPASTAPLSVDDVKVVDKDVVAIDSLTQGADASAYTLTVRALADGDTAVRINKATFDLRAHVENGVIIANGADFSGWESIYFAIIVFLIASIILLASGLAWLRKRIWFDYEMVVIGGIMLFCAVELGLLAFQGLTGTTTSFTSLAVSLTRSLDTFLVLTFPPLALMSFAVSASNVALIRHEGMRPVNVLGIAVSIVWFVTTLAWILLGQNLRFAIPSPAVVLFIDSAVAVAIALGECLLVSTVICAWRAAKHTPKRVADYIVVLGCGLMPDGAPTPLLRGRVDRALAFDAAQAQRGCEPVVFVPSGGQGPDEVISEAESMRRYLVGKGVPDARILPEDRSTRTSENMAFSRAAIEGATGSDVANARVSFSTTNYHVFRGYVCAHEAGIDAEGMASPTKSYFWPNAFLREFVGLHFKQWHRILAVYLLSAASFCILQYALLLQW